MYCYTGRLFEEEVVGRCLWNCADYVPFRKAMTIVKNFQPWDPTDPSSPVMNDFHALLCEALGLEDYSLIGIYTAVGSPLDLFHGIDVFVEWNNVFVTIDLTINSKKDEYKADIILHEEDVYTEDGRVNRARLQEVAHYTALLLEAASLIPAPVFARKMEAKVLSPLP